MKLGLGLGLGNGGPSAPSYGPELVTNGDGSTATGWTGSSATLSSVGGRLRVTNTAGFGSASQTISGLTIGATYRFVIDRVSGTANGTSYIQFHNGETLASGPAVADAHNFVADATSHTIFLECSSGSAADNTDFDNISVKKVL